jgi:hypothetical protein
VRFGRSVPDGWLPVYRVRSEKEAKRLLIAACQTNLDGEFLARELLREQTLENLDAFSARLEAVHKMIQQRPGPRRTKATLRPRNNL